MEFDPGLAWRELRPVGFNGHVGPIRFAQAGDLIWMASLDLDTRHMNAGGVCHGGLLMTLADVVMGAASFEAAERHPCATIEMNSHFVAAAKSGQTALAKAEQLRHAGGLSFMKCEIWSGGRLVLRASGIWKYLSQGGGGPT